MQTAQEPLAYRMRPRTLDEFFGQKHIVGPDAALRSMIERDGVSSVILSGPPGTGKTTLAHIIAEHTKAQFVPINAVMSGVKELKETCMEARKVYEAFGQRTLVFIDEIHRFNKAQQDALLPYVEQGVVILVGATTENPYFEVNAALVSRSRVELLQPLSVDELVHILRRALADDRGFAGAVRVEDAALQRIAQVGNGDARIALNALELAVVTAGGRVQASDIASLYPHRSFRYDRTGEDHYNTVSAFIKTLRGSDPDAALIWLYKMILSGEEPRFLFRRMAIFASEDIGNADPSALGVVMQAQQAFEFVGLPEGEYFLAHACIYLAQAPKSPAIKRAMKEAKSAVESAATLEVPMHLRNAPVKGMKDQGYGKGYRDPHAEESGVASSSYFPIGMQPQELYRPTQRGFEEEVSQRLSQTRRILSGELQE